MDNRPIGIMDSGVGGLTVARYLKKNTQMKESSLSGIRRIIRMEIKQRKKSRHWRRPFGITC